MARKALRPDYNEDPERFRTARRTQARHASEEDVHRRVAQRFIAEGLTPVLDVGCGEGELATHLPAGAWVGVDSSAIMLARAPSPHFLAQATGLPFDDRSFAAVAFLYVLYHLSDPTLALCEARRVLRPGGLVAAAAPSQADSPELADFLPSARLTFDAELAPNLLSRFFTDIEVERWDLPILELPDESAVRDYLIGKGADHEAVAAGSQSVSLPLRVTKRGALVFARRR